MRLRYFERKKGRVEIIPMIDVMLFLLVFFIIVTLQMIPDAGVSLQLAHSSQTQHLAHPKFTVNILPDGTVKVKGATLTPDALTVMLAGDGDPAKTQVTIAADKAVAFQHFMTVMDASRKAGVTEIGVAAQPETDAAAALPAAAPAPTEPTPAAAAAGSASGTSAAVPVSGPAQARAASGQAPAPSSAPSPPVAGPTPGPAAVSAPPKKS